MGEIDYFNFKIDKFYSLKSAQMDPNKYIGFILIRTFFLTLISADAAFSWEIPREKKYDVKSRIMEVKLEIMN